MVNHDVQVTDNPSEQRYEARLGETLAGFAEYQLGDGVISLVHTEVGEEHQGAGVGSALARAALDDVRRDGGRKVIAKCSFIAEWIDRHPDYRDLLA